MSGNKLFKENSAGIVIKNLFVIKTQKSIVELISRWINMEPLSYAMKRRNSYNYFRYTG